MKAVIAFALFIVGITAFPQKSLSPIFEALHRNDERLVTGSIITAIEDASQAIKDAGLDPINIKSYALNYELPVPVLFNMQAFVEEMLFEGMSNIVVHSMNYSILTNRLTFDIRLPFIEFSLGESALDVTVFGSSTNFYASGRLAIVDIKLTGNIRVSIGIITGISIRSMDLGFSLADIESALTIKTHGIDLSSYVNNFLGVIVPETLSTFESEINELLVIVGLQIAEQIL